MVSSPGAPRAALVALVCACIASAGADVGDWAMEDPIDFIASLADMPEKEQDVYLDVAGMMLMDEGNTDCNIFGGTKSCKELPADSTFAMSCKDHRDNFKVDCAYYTSSLEDLKTDPEANLERALGSDKTASLRAYCPQCLGNLQSLWCAQAMPKCGSFKDHVQKALFPAVLEFKRQQEDGEPQDVAVAAAIPGLLAAMSKTMACKEMCEAVIRTCSCDADGVKTLGEIINAGERSSEVPMDQSILAMDDVLLKDVWDKPLCDLFASKDDPEFAGVCDESVVNSQCTNKDVYCNGIDNEDKDFVEEMVAAEIAHGMLGFVQGPSGLIQQDGEFVKEAEIGMPNVAPSNVWSNVPPQTAEEQESMETVANINAQQLQAPAASWESDRGGHPHPPHHPAFIVGHIFFVLCMMSLSAVGGVVAWKKYLEYKERSSGADYQPLDEVSPTRAMGA